MNQGPHQPQSNPSDIDAEIARLRSLHIDEASIAARIRLTMKVDVRFDANRLVNVFDYLQRVSGVNLSVEWTPLEAAGVEQDVPITLSLHNVTVEHVLRLVLQQASGFALEPIELAVRQGVVHVSTRRELSRYVETRVYDVRHLLTPVKDGPTTVDLGQQLLDMLTVNVGRQEDWLCYGGDISAAHILNGSLTVRTTPENQIVLIQLLSYLTQVGLDGEVDQEGDDEESPAEANTEPDNADSSEGQTRKRQSMSWTAARDRLERIRKSGEPYTSQDELAERIGCGQATVNKAIQKTSTLEKWMNEALNQKGRPKATSFNEIVTDKTADTSIPDPTEESIEEDEIDAVMARLINEANPVERAKLNELNAEGRRRMALAYRDHTRDDEPSPLDDDPPDRSRKVKHIKTV